MESNEQTELTSTRERHRWRADDRQLVGRLQGGGIEQKKITHGHGQQDGDCWG